MTDTPPTGCHIAVTGDPGYLWLSCVRDANPFDLQEVEAGDTWDDLAAVVERHQAEHGPHLVQEGDCW